MCSSDLCAAIVAAGGLDGFVAKLDADGACVWAKSLGGSGTDRVTALLVDDAGGVIVSGSYGVTMSFAGDTLPPGPGTFLAKLDESGGETLVRGFQGGTVRSIAKGNNRIYAAGSYVGTVTNADFTLPNAQTGGGMVVAYSATTGAFAWARGFPDTSGGAAPLVFRDVATTEGRVALIGSLRGNVAFDGTELSTGTYDVVFVELDGADGAVTAADRYGAEIGRAHV